MRSKIIIEIICFLGIAFGVFCGYLTIYQINKRNREILRQLNKLELAQIGIDVKLAQVNIMGIIKKEEKKFLDTERKLDNIEQKLDNIERKLDNIEKKQEGMGQTKATASVPPPWVWNGQQGTPLNNTTKSPVFEIKDGVLLFMRSSNLEEVVVPNGVKNVCIEGVVGGGMKKLTIPEGVEEISRRSGGYSPNTKIESIRLPASVKKIEVTAFDGHWRKLRTIDIAPGSPYTMQNGCLVDTRNNSLVFALPGQEKIVVPDSVKIIGDWSFNANDVREIVVPEGIVKIGRGGFDDCYSLETISLPASVETIGTEAFSNCGKLSRIEIASGNQCFVVRDGFLLEQKTDKLIRAFGPLRNVTIPEDVKTIGYGAFSCMASLESVIVPATVRRIEYNAFAYCRNLKELRLPEQLDFYDSHLISGCDKLSEIRLPIGLKTIRGNASFSGCSSLRELVFPEGVQTIEGGALGAVYKCNSLERIFIPASVSTIRTVAFMSNPKLKTYDVHPDNQAFCSKDGVLFSKDMTRLVRCPNTKNGVYEIPQTVQKIDSHAFSQCRDLKKIWIPKAVTDIGSGAFSGCSALEIIEFENQSFKLDDHVFGGWFDGPWMGGEKPRRPATNLSNQ